MQMSQHAQGFQDTIMLLGQNSYEQKDIFHRIRSYLSPRVTSFCPSEVFLRQFSAGSENFQIRICVYAAHECVAYG